MFYGDPWVHLDGSPLYMVLKTTIFCVDMLLNNQQCQYGMNFQFSDNLYLY
jgi:hypothetical protein